MTHAESSSDDELRPQPVKPSHAVDSSDDELGPQPVKRMHAVDSSDDELGPQPVKPLHAVDSSDDELGPQPVKPSHAVDSSDDELGPQPVKQRRLDEGSLDLTMAELYERSFQHKAPVTLVATSGATEFLISASSDGIVKFWKKLFEGVEFVKAVKTHDGEIIGMSVSPDSLELVTIGADGYLKFFDVANFSVYAMIKLPFKPSSICHVGREVAVASMDSPIVAFFSAATGSTILRKCDLHTNPVSHMCYSRQTIVSADSRGIIDVWSIDSLTSKFKSKLDTDLYAVAKAKAKMESLVCEGGKFCVRSSDGLLRVFDLSTGKILTTVDTAKAFDSQLQMSQAGMNHRVKREAGLEFDKSQSVTFDKSGRLLVYSTLFGIQIYDIAANRLVRVLGKEESSERFVSVALYEGPAQKRVSSDAMASEGEVWLKDPTLICTANVNRVFFFSNRLPEATRDVFNETFADEKSRRLALPIKLVKPAKEAIIQTTAGDITLQLFPGDVPRTTENFVTHAKNGYFNGCVFHRVIKGFMIQTGDPTSTGSGGESIWGGQFEDEIRKHLRHDRPFTVSMANSGPNTNGSQFFITTVPCPWLDGKHTVFGRVSSGQDAVVRIENMEVSASDRPLNDVRILGIQINH